jgi:DNA polymerase IV
VIVAGSYRRGNLDSGDIDLLVTKSEASVEHIRTLMMENVVPELTRQGFLKTALATSFDRQGSKWHGACVLPGSSVWRRLDLLFVPRDELGAALVYFTGNQLFNRSMRLLARKQGMRLNQHGLYKDVIRGRGGVKINDGTLLEGRDERRIFELLGVTYRRPGHRRC